MSIITYIIAAFAVIGAADRIAGNRLGLGEKFEQAFFSMGPLVLSMVGMLVMAPVIADVLSPVMTPIFQAIGADPSVFAGIFLAMDMGGAPLARELALNPDSARLAGIIIGSMLGATIVFHIPVSLEIAGEDGDSIARGMIAGLITLPVGCFAGGLAAGFSMSLVLHDLLPVTIISLLLAFGMWKFREPLVRGFVLFGKFILIIATAGIALGILQSLTGLTPIKGIAPVDEAFAVVATVAIFLAGAFPLMHVITRLLQKPLRAIGSKVGINETSAAGPILSLANTIPMLESMKDMDTKGKIINSAFCVSGAFLLGDNFAYAAAYDAPMLIPMIIGKLVAAIAAVLLALWMTRNLSDNSVTSR